MSIAARGRSAVKHAVAAARREARFALSCRGLETAARAAPRRRRLGHLRCCPAKKVLTSAYPAF
jgi:hypothetical protein